jgi:hypothetical protein
LGGRRLELAYFADVFTPATWSAFLADGARVTAFREISMRRGARHVAPGDRFLCYLKGGFSFVGALEAQSTARLEQTPIWGFTEFPVRVDVHAHAVLTADQALPLTALEGRVSFYPVGKDVTTVPAYFQGSPRSLKEHDGSEIWRAIVAHDDGVKPAPSPDQDDSPTIEPAVAIRKHVEIQALLAEFGLATGCSVWIPRNDRPAVGRADPEMLGRLLRDLPFIFAGKAQQIVQNIDVIWMQGDAVVATFEVENTTSIYSGLLRMSDLVALMPNLNFPMYIVAPEGRRSSVRDEIIRPTFATLSHPLATKCGYIAAEALQQRRASIGDDTLRYLRPGFIHGLAEHFN